MTTLTDTDARRIASEWHGGAATALYAFASTGAIDWAPSLHRADHQMAHEIDENRAHGTHGTPELDDLDALMTYVRHHGPRGPVDGWSNLTW